MIYLVAGNIGIGNKENETTIQWHYSLSLLEFTDTLLNPLQSDEMSLLAATGQRSAFFIDKNDVLIKYEHAHMLLSFIFYCLIKSTY